ncbi:hypothetical protein F9L33_13140 [Amylibacter sp. SFDW26]|uniref:hypothetical protein n=1 Tax=Amylibacter sp. SFDW26 TaxID=2652722 RepID=UPI0012619E5C|nr:hypothetical protein [Amylibacter sp. SFDW26]KAB7610252.1 hypothetical protein F9L33_13140 [Amylibacter sp. SFDW26]
MRYILRYYKAFSLMFCLLIPQAAHAKDADVVAETIAFTKACVNSIGTKNAALAGLAERGYKQATLRKKKSKYWLKQGAYDISVRVENWKKNSGYTLCIGTFFFTEYAEGQKAFQTSLATLKKMGFSGKPVKASSGENKFEFKRGPQLITVITKHIEGSGSLTEFRFIGK